jgi:hypothetical protein
MTRGGCEARVFSAALMSSPFGEDQPMGLESQVALVTGRAIARRLAATGPPWTLAGHPLWGGGTSRKVRASVPARSSARRTSPSTSHSTARKRRLVRTR